MATSPPSIRRTSSVYNLENRFLERNPVVTVVGCGGTGCFVAEGLARLLPRNIYLLLIDHDRVEERNLGRSSYTRADVDQFKSKVMARRLAQHYQRPVGYSIAPVGLTEIHKGLIIGCVDNCAARKVIADNWKGYSWWVDSGNDRNYGQILIGNTPKEHLAPAFTDGICFRLPLPTIQHPELLTQVAPRPSCNDLVAAGDQGPTINQAMGAIVLEVVRRIIEGTCPWMQLYLDLDAGTLTPVLATPEMVSSITGRRVKELTKKGG